MKRAKTSRQRSPLDDPKFWTTEIRPPYFARELWQARLDLRAGKNKDGKSVLVLRWAPEVFTEMFDGSMPRYWVSRIKDGEGFIYTSPPRWVIERRLEREQYVDSWNESRWIDDGSGNMIDKGPPPGEYHIFTWLCANHERPGENGQPRCCQRAWDKDRSRCWGTYRQPNDYDLQCVEAAVKRREGERFIDPYAKLSASDLEVIEASSAVQMDRAAAEAEERAREILRDQKIYSDYGARLYDVGASRRKSLIN